MSNCSEPEAFPPPAPQTRAWSFPPPSRLPVQASTAKSVLRIFAGVTSVAIGFWAGSAALALTSMSATFGPRLAWLGFLLGFTAVCSVVTGVADIIRHARNDLRVPALSMAFAAISVLGFVAVYVALPVVTPMLGGLVLAALGIVVIALTAVFGAAPALAPVQSTHESQ